MAMTAFLCGCSQMSVDNSSGLAPSGFTGETPAAPVAAPADQSAQAPAAQAEAQQTQFQQQAPAEAPAPDPQTPVWQAPPQQQAPPVQEAPAEYVPDTPAVPETPAAEEFQAFQADPDDLFAGTYYETQSGRGVLTIMNIGGNNYSVNITWSDSAFQSYNWELSGEFDGRACLHYDNCTKRLFSAETGTADTIYSSGSGYIQMRDDGQVAWSDYTDGTEYTFTRAYY